MNANTKNNSKTNPKINYCYLLQNVAETKTYIGSTNNFTRRIKQHNGALCGGARYTAGDCWKPAILLSGFISWSQTLRFEYIWKHCRLRDVSSRRGIVRRFEILEYLLKKEEWQHLTVWTHAEIACVLDCTQVIRDIEEIIPNNYQ